MTDRSAASIERFHILHRSEGRPDAGAISREAREHVSAAFKSLEGKISVVQGRRLLSSLRQAVAETYGVSFSNDQIIEEMTPDEIPQEVKDLIEAL